MIYHILEVGHFFSVMDQRGAPAENVQLHDRLPRLL